MKISRVKTQQDAKAAEQLILEAYKPGGFVRHSIPIPVLKDKLAWLSWANLKRPEQPSFIVKDGNKIIAGIFGEPVEKMFDIGEAEIQDLLFLPGNEDAEIAKELFGKVLEFYKLHKAKQVHFWALESKYKSGRLEAWKKSAMDGLSFKFQGFKKISKWSGKMVYKIEKSLRK